MRGFSLALRNGIWNLMGTAASSIAGILASILIIRSLTPEEYGRLSYYIWLAGLLSSLGVLSFPVALTKLTAELRGRERLEEGQALIRWVAKGLLGANFLLGLLIAVWALQAPPQARFFLWIIAILPVINALGRLLFSSFWGHERYKPTAFALGVAALTQLLLTFLAYTQGWGIRGFFVAMLSVHLVALGVLALYARIRPPLVRARTALHPSPGTRRRFWVFAAPITILAVIEMIVWQRSEVFFLERFSTAAQIGYYNLAFTVYALCIGLGVALMNGYFPSISRNYGAKQWTRVQEQIRQGILLANLYAVPLSLGALATLQGVVLLLFGAKMLPAVPAAYILFAGLVPAMTLSVFGLALSAINRPWALIPLGVATSVLNLGLDLLLIPSRGAVGGAMANTLAQATFALGAYFVLQRVLRRTLGASRPLPIVPWRALAGVWAVGLGSAYLGPYWIQAQLPGGVGVGLAVPLATLLYLLVIWRLGYYRALRTPPAGDTALRYRILHILGDRYLPKDPDAEATGGLTRVALELAWRQRRDGHEVWVVTVGARRWQGEWRGVRLVSLRFAPLPPLPLKGRRLAFQMHLPYVFLTWRHRFDIVHGHQYYYARWLRAGGRVLHFHNDPCPPRFDHARALSADDLKVIARYGDALVAVSRFVADELERGLRQARTEGYVVVVYNGVDLERFFPERWAEARVRLRREWGVPDEATVFAYVGGIIPQKGVLHLARAFERLAQRTRDVYLVLAGGSALWRSEFGRSSEGRTYEEEVRHTLASLQKEGRVRFLGVVPPTTLPAVYAAADVGVTPSVFREPAGLVALEAQASGRPVIASRIGGLPEMVAPDGGVLVPPGDEPALEEAMWRFSRDRARREAMGREALRWAERFSWVRASETLAALYGRILGGGEVLAPKHEHK
ncbi:glycosyltransferase [Marinithermus hydrothermalis]|uniref:Glycosyl transferase group 1 n=1 Tax=Marinithermus hydrothermalis (strain DSM 14884 / JCM 11576 / T1) TaxID=869210 RepID=F2NKF2_MARHT|nr:glycosyltransferase [Marinithermus hydrothermalis]AEB12401.1 glycosyl transferase group 1 [Marinithermus hydrothermalis DSM 14884]